MKPCVIVTFLAAVILTISLASAKPMEYARFKRGAAYAGSHPGSGYGVGGTGIPGITNVIQYTAYNKLLNSGHGGGGGGGGYGGSGHGRKLTVDQAIGMFGHHTLNRSYPYTAEHGSGGGHGGGSGGGGYGR
ncbi:unnamed protein product [Orchesella dallaii]|uniref:Uncharacterized protein n=1 Tax=Orchesella dallaii TaxID=48710 RepID=A0ABP1RCN2_9HEXA